MSDLFLLELCVGPVHLLLGRDCITFIISGTSIASDLIEGWCGWAL